jgi:uroporphyrin-III C-methyltransferase
VTVSLVGAGPGDPELITVRGLGRVRRADVLIFDRLVGAELVAEAPGLRIGRDRLSQEKVNALLVAYGRRGLRVVRLKGGDPFVFGRGGEEALALLDAGIDFEVVPGVSSIASVPGAAGIPVTHRGLSTGVVAVTARDRLGNGIDFARFAGMRETLLVFMGLEALPSIARGLIAHGADPGTPAAVVSRGTLPDQASVAAPLSRIAASARGLATPALLVVGEVVAVAEALTAERPRAAAAAAAAI